jgi:uncharacterized membrane protein YecN with MAPEG domain
MPPFVIHPVVLACIAVLGLLVFGLGLAVSLARGKAHVLIGVTPDPDAMLNRLVRAHGNTAEYAPMLAVLFCLQGFQAPSPVTLAMVVVATAARVLIVAGLLTARTLSRPSPLRFAGAATTYFVGIWLAIRLLAQA